jgi:hypothetical protein
MSVPFGYTLDMSVLRNARFERACMRCEHGPAERSGRVPGVSSCSCPGLETRFWVRSVVVVLSARTVAQPLLSLCFPLPDTDII